MITGTIPSPPVALEALKPSARFIDLAGSGVDAQGWLTILESSESGVIQQFHVRSPNTSFRVAIVIDDINAFNKTYDEIRQIEQSSPEISAFAELDEDGELTGYYIASIRDIAYYNSILLKVQNTGATPVTFSQLFVKYDIKR